MTVQAAAQSVDLNAISVFAKVVEAGSFSGAARLLNMPKTTVSARVAALEAALNVTLIHRTTRKLYVTDPGRRYFQHCLKALQELGDAHAELASASEQPQGLFRITAPVDIGHTVLPRLVAAFTQKYPQVQVELLLSNRIVDLVGEGVDLALRAGARKDSSLVGKRFFELTANVWASPAFLARTARPKTPQALARLAFIAYSGARFVQMSNGKSTARVPMTSRLGCDDFEGIKKLVLLGCGVGWLPDFLAAEEAAAGLLVPALPGWKAKSEGQVFFTYPSHGRASPNVRAFTETALAMTGSQPAG